jgi:hypothetical protein
MKITIEVPDEHGLAFEEWLRSVKKPISTTHAREVSLVISTEIRRYKPARTTWMDTNALRIPLLAITHDYVRQFAVYDVVENAHSGDWGVVTKIEGDVLTVKASKETVDKTGAAKLEIHISNARHLV